MDIRCIDVRPCSASDAMSSFGDDGVDGFEIWQAVVENKRASSVTHFKNSKVNGAPDTRCGKDGLDGTAQRIKLEGRTCRF